MPKPIGIHHITILVTNLERSRKFYGEVLGLQEKQDMPDFGRPLIWYQVGPTQVHILPKESVAVNQSDDLSSLAWNRHVAIGIEDFSEIKQRLDDENLPYCENPNSALGLRQLFFQDPDGNGLEFMVPDSFDEAARLMREKT